MQQDNSDFSDEETPVPLVAKPPSRSATEEPKPRDTGGSSSGDMRARIAELEARNAELREEAQKYKRWALLPESPGSRPSSSHLIFPFSPLISRADGAEKRAAGIERKFEVFREKERRDTAALEKMVQDIEQNLKLSNSRALAAEANATRLQQELNKTLAELQAERLNRTGGAPADFGPYTSDNIADIHSRVNHVSLELKALSENARNAVQMLLSNTQTLERCSLSLQNLDKVTELGLGGSKGNR